MQFTPTCKEHIGTTNYYAITLQTSHKDKPLGIEITVTEMIDRCQEHTAYETTVTPSTESLDEEIDEIEDDAVKYVNENLSELIRQAKDGGN